MLVPSEVPPPDDEKKKMLVLTSSFLYLECIWCKLTPAREWRKQLVVTRKPQQKVVLLNTGIEITVLSVQGQKIKLGFKVPDTITVLREELVNREETESKEDN